MSETNHAAECGRFAVALSRLVDRPDDDDCAAAREHVAACGDCSARLALLRTLGERVADLPPPTLSPRVAERIERALHSESHASARLAPILVATSLVAVALALLFALMRPVDVVSELADDFAVDNAREKPLGVATGDVDALSRWFAERLPFSVTLPRIDEGIWRGGRLCAIGGRPVALAFLDVEGAPMSLFAIGPDGPAPSEGCAARRDDVHVCSRRAGDVTYALVARLPQERLRSLLAVEANP